MKKCKFMNGFYSRILLFNTILICVVSAIAAYYIGMLASQHQQAEVLKKYEIALNELYTGYNSKHEGFAGLMSGFFTDQGSYSDMYSLLQTEELDDLDAGTKARLVSVLERLCEKDASIVGVMVYSPEKNTLFQYNMSGRTIIQLALDEEFPVEPSFDRLVLTDGMIKGLSRGFVSPEQHVYALGGNIAKSIAGKYQVMGEILVLYSTSGLYQSIANRQLDYENVYSITDSKGNVLFNSEGNYMPVSAPDSRESNSSSVLRQTNGAAYYTATLANRQRNFYAAYRVKKSSVDTGSSYIQGLFVLISAILCAFSIITYLIVYRLSAKKLGMIQRGMKRIGSNNLLYRIPESKGSDEFTTIINHFNQMCDQLQQNIEKAYVYELQQQNAELYALQTSINPHFLYNTLEVIRVRLDREGCSEASEMIVLLSKIYRNQIKGEMFLSLSEEMNQCSLFIDLYLYRFDNFEYSFSIPREFYSYGIPKNTLQPLIENYFVHGIDVNSDTNLIEISACWDELEDERCIRITVSNNGKPIEEERLAELRRQLDEPVLQNKGSGFGIANVNSRLRIVFGEKCGLKLRRCQDGTGFAVDILIKPMLPEELAGTFRNIPKLPEKGDRSHV